MTTITKRTEIPETSFLKKEENSFHYIDSFQGIIPPTGQTDLARILNLFLFDGPSWADHLLTLRDKLVGIFGLKTSEKVSNDQKQVNITKCEPGEQLGIFKLYARTENEFVLGEDDKHLNVRVSLLLESSERKLSITTCVIFNNFFGRLYFIPVKPVHRQIVKASMRRIVRNLDV